MDTAVNFYELKTQLADLGFNSPELVDGLRQQLSAEAYEFRLPFEELTGNGMLRCTFDFRRPEPGQPVLLNHYDSSLWLNENAGSAYRTFTPEIGKTDACLVLAQARTSGEGADDLPWAMGMAEVARYLEKDIPRELDAGKLEELERQLQELGFSGPSSKDALEAILIYSRQEATLHTLLPAGEREAEFSLAYTEFTGSWRLYGIEGALQRPDGAQDIQNFKPDVPAEEAIQFLQQYHQLSPLHDPFRPLARNEIQTHLEKFKMNEENLAFNQKSVQYLGFDQKTADEVTDKIKQGQPEFQVNTRHEHFNNSMDFTLHFKKSTETEMYFFNKYQATLTNGKPEEDRSQTFYIKNGHGFTAKEAFNQLEGRAVYKELRNKEGQPYTAWSKLELDKEKNASNNYPVRTFSAGWGYDLEKSVSRFPVQELNDQEQKAALLKSLQKGNQQQVTIDKDGKPEKFYLEAVPALRTINIYDSRRKEVKRETLLKPELKIKKDKKEEQSQDQQQSKKRGRGRGI